MSQLIAALRLSVIWVVAAAPENCPYDASAWHQWKHSWTSEPASQRALDRTIAGGRWARGAWVAPEPVDVARSFAGKRILLLGGSTTRRLVFTFILTTLNETAHAQFLKFTKNDQDLFHGAGINTALERSLADHGWRFQHFPCEVNRGYGCSDCRCNCNDGTYSPRRDWLDFEARGPAGTSIHFSWKPELYTRADERAVATRWSAAREPYDLIHVGKGLHDAAFHRQPGVAAHGRYVVAQGKKFGCLVRSLPACSLVVIRTPYLDTNGAEKADVACTRHALARLSEDGAFGKRSVLADAFAITSAPGAPHTYDGHHYMHPTHAAVWQMLALALTKASTRCSPVDPVAEAKAAAARLRLRTNPACVELDQSVKEGKGNCQKGKGIFCNERKSCYATAACKLCEP